MYRSILSHEDDLDKLGFSSGILNGKSYTMTPYCLTAAIYGRNDILKWSIIVKTVFIITFVLIMMLDILIVSDLIKGVMKGITVDQLSDMFQKYGIGKMYNNIRREIETGGAMSWSRFRLLTELLNLRYDLKMYVKDDKKKDK